MKKKPLETLNPGQIITITDGYYHNALGVFRVTKQITSSVIREAGEAVSDDIKKQDIEENGREFHVEAEDITEALPRKLMELGYLEFIDSVELHLGDVKIEPVIYGNDMS